ncbi:MAG TPA: CS domain-containing protein [Methanoregula sp.]|nr:CS domain-containing protein [Methanoregula sp.]
MADTEDSGNNEFFGDVSRIVGEFIRRIPLPRGGQLAGYMVVPRGPLKPPVIFRVIGDRDDRRLQYESIESVNFQYITIGLPVGAGSTVWVDLEPCRVRIFIGELVATIRPSRPIDVLHSHYRLHRGVLDITLRKTGAAATISR